MLEAKLKTNKFESTAKVSSQKAKERVVTDEFGQKFKLVSKLGEGGQGIVCTTQFDKILVKISTASKDKKGKWLEHIRWLMKQPLEELNIAKPFSRIAIGNTAGYAMELMDHLIPLKLLMDETETGIEESEGSPESYINSGGLKRRMNLLARLARTIAKLHERGMAYGDLSPANVYISEDIEHDQVWLIDCDNICVNQRASQDYEFLEGKAGRVFSPGYGAPEIVNGHAFVSSLTDSWSFAVLAFKLLTTNHPFIGEVVDSGTPEDEDRAFSGELPWVYHQEDFSNEVFNGIPIEFVALKPLLNLFNQCFDEGKDNPVSRPTMSQWAELIEKISHTLVDCQEETCSTSFNFQPINKKLICPFCDSESGGEALRLLRNYYYDSSILDLENTTPKDCYIDVGNIQTVNFGKEIAIKSSSVGSCHWEKSTTLFTVTINSNGIEINIPQSEYSIEVGYDIKKLQPFKSKVVLGKEKRKQKMLIIKVIPASQLNIIDNLFMLRW